MFRKVLLSKIHRATVTQADLDYEGSLTLSPELLEASGIAPYEAINVWNVTQGTRFETYAICGEPGSSDLCVNGAAAHLAKAGDLVIIACFGYLTSEEFARHEPRVVFVDDRNKIKELGTEVPGPKRRAAA